MLGFLFSPNGRISRADIWLKYLLPLIVLSIAAEFADMAIAGHRSPTGGPVRTILNLFYLWPGIAVPIKRFHDRGMTGWWVLFSTLLLIPGAILLGIGLAQTGMIQPGMTTIDPQVFSHVGPVFWAGCAYIVIECIVLFVILYILPGQQGVNKYGADPRG